MQNLYCFIFPSHCSSDCFCLYNLKVWDVVTDDEAVNFVRNCIVGSASVRASSGSGGGGGNHQWVAVPAEAKVQDAADLLVSTASDRGSRDNLTAAVLAFRWD